MRLHSTLSTNREQRFLFNEMDQMLIVLLALEYLEFLLSFPIMNKPLSLEVQESTGHPHGSKASKLWSVMSHNLMTRESLAVNSLWPDGGNEHDKKLSSLLTKRDRFFLVLTSKHLSNLIFRMELSGENVQHKILHPVEHLQYSLSKDSFQIEYVPSSTATATNRFCNDTQVHVIPGQNTRSAIK